MITNTRVVSSAHLVLLLMVVHSPRVWSQENGQTSTEEAKLLRTFVEEFVAIAPGRGGFPQEFEMGSLHSREEQPVHIVRLDGEFAIGKYEVPQNLYEAVMGNNPSRWKGPRNSAERMTWLEAVEFCQRISRRLQEAELIAVDELIRLPTEAEWEYCCRAGTKTAYSFGDEATASEDLGDKASLLDPYAWHTGNAAGNDPEVGALKPNPWGLYDMHGYLWEYTADDWHETYENSPPGGKAWASDDTAVADGETRQIVVRGGSWKDPSPRLRCAARKPFPINARDDAVGFRCVKAKVSK